MRTSTPDPIDGLTLVIEASTAPGQFDELPAQVLQVAALALELALARRIVEIVESVGIAHLASAADASTRGRAPGRC